MAIVDAIVFDLNNALTTSGGVIPKFLRHSTAALEYSDGGSLRLITAGEHKPRIGTDGTLTLEQGAVNLITHPQRLNDSSWTKGSSVTVIPDIIQGLDANYLADRVSFSAYTGNANAQILRKALTIGQGRTMTVSAYLALAAGRFGGNDVLRVSGSGLVAAASVPLGPIYNDKLGQYIRTDLTFQTSGTATTEATETTTGETQSTVNLDLYCESAVSVNWAGIQMEVGNLATSYIAQEGASRSRDADRLEYPKNPVEGLASFVVYLNLVGWGGNGVILNTGNLRLEIVSGKLRATVGAVVVNDPNNLPANAKIALRVSQGLQRAQLYVNGVMVAKEAISNYTATAGPMTIGGVGIRKLRTIYCFNRDLSDGSIDVGGTVGGEMFELHQQDNLLKQYSEAYSEFDLPPVRIKPAQKVPVRFQFYQDASQAIATLTPGAGATAQVQTVTVNSAAVNQVDVVVIDGVEFSRTATTTNAADQASGLATLINASTAIPVTANWVSGASFTLTADVPGNDFALSVRGKLAVTTTTANQVGTHTLTVAAAIDYVPGRALIFRDYAYVCEIQITAVNAGSNTITFTTTPNSNINLIWQGDQLIQTEWELAIGTGNYFASHRENYPEIKIVGKSIEGFLLENKGTTERRVTPYATVTL